MELEALRKEFRRLVDERLAGIADDKAIVIDLVNLDRDGKGGLVHMRDEVAIYVPPGPTPDYVIDRAARTILIGRSRGAHDATAAELRDACRRALNEFFGN